jgi:hypothetical protein
MYGHIWTPPDCNRLIGSGAQSQLLTYIRLLDAVRVFVPRAPMDFRALPPQRRPDIGICHAGPHTRFGKRRSDRFTISYHLFAIAR